jgi:hypothetical protein
MAKVEGGLFGKRRRLLGGEWRDKRKGENDQSLLHT